jgi:hypothetical protein
MNAKLALRTAARLLSPGARETSRRMESPDVMAVFRAAARIEPDPAEVMVWYCDTPIAELDGSSAKALVASGRADEVLAFLREIGDDRRG